MRHVSIGGIPYEFHLVPDRIEEGTEDERVGEADLNAQVIRVTNQGPAELIEQTFLHEVLHAIAHIYNIRSLNKPSAEEIIDNLSLGLMVALRSVGMKLSDYMEEEES